MRVPHWRFGAIALAVILTLGAGACGSSSKSSTSTSTSGATASTGSGGSTGNTTGSSASGTTIDIHNFMFSPSPFQAKVGQTITVTNQDGTNHSLTANDGSFDTGVYASGDKTITITKAGTYSIHCRIHPFMTGTIVVS